MKGDLKENLLDVAQDDSSLKNKIWSETKKLWIVAGPSILLPFSTFGIHAISQAFIGHIGTTELAAYALVFTVLFGFVLGIQVGMVGGVGTLCGQAFGAKQYHKLGIYLQQSFIILLTVSALLTPLFVFAAPILKALGQDHDIADMAGNIAFWFISVTFLYAVLYSCNSFLQSQSKNFILSCYAFLSLFVHIFLSWLLAVKLKFGIPGVMVSTVLAFLIPNIGQLTYMMCGGCRETWKGFTALAFKDLGLTVKLSISSGVMICLEFCYNMILIVLTGNMENADIAIDALSICLIISNWAMVVSSGFLAAVSVRVSNELGKRDAKAAKFSILIAVLTSFSIGLVLLVLFLTFKKNAAYMFTKSEEVAEAVARLSPLLAFSLLLNSIQPVLTGVANGAGQQGIVAYVNLGSYYLVGIPLGVLLGYVFKLQVQGVWMGMIIGIAVQTSILAIMTCTTDWDKQQSFIILLIVSALLTPLFVFAAPILKALGQDHDIADMAGNIALWFISVTFLYAVLYSCNSFLQSQSKNFILSFYALLSLFIHIFLLWLLAVKLKFGIPGIMVSTVLAYLIPNVGQLVYVMCGGCRETWKGFTTLAFKDLGLTIKLSISSGVMICLEFCYNTILILLTGNMENAEITIDALSICLNISGWALMVSFGFMAAASVRVSNELGRKDAKAAKFSIVMTVLTSFSIGLVLFVFFLLFKENAAYMFTKSEEVAEAVARLSPLLAFTLLLNSVQPVLSGKPASSGVANGAGQQGIVAYVNLGSYYLVGIPLGVLLGYVFKLQVQGVWIGMIIGTTVQTAILAIMTIMTDWDKQVSLAQKRISPLFVEDETSHHSSNHDTEAA
ncbi:MATE efflux family protein [Perilla frutescens var. frutescens]|nr:MATE efflux family protein [Perilla frutescens var. frutescens]